MAPHQRPCAPPLLLAAAPAAAQVHFSAATAQAPAAEAEVEASCEGLGGQGIQTYFSAAGAPCLMGPPLARGRRCRRAGGRGGI